MISELQIMLEIGFFLGDKDVHISNVFVQLKWKLNQVEYLLVRNVWRCHVQGQQKLRL